MYRDNAVSTHRPLILCVDDDCAERGKIARQLEDAKYAVVEASNGAEAVVALNSQRPDLILCDISMPFMGGCEFLRFVRETRSDLDDVPFLYLTDSSDPIQVQDMSIDADAYLRKPTANDQLLEAIRNQIAKVNRIRRAMHRRIEQGLDGMMQSAPQSQGLLKNIGWMFDSIWRGCIVLDDEGNVRAMNDTAQSIIENADGLAIVDGRLCSADQKEKSRLHHLIRATLDRTEQGGAVAIPRRSARPLLLQVFALNPFDHETSPSVAILIQDPDLRPTIDQNVVAQMYRLTRMETKLALAMVDGMRADKVASSFGISQTTVSFHLRNLFRKTGTNRQADLIALLIQSATSHRSGERSRVTAQECYTRDESLCA